MNELHIQVKLPTNQVVITHFVTSKLLHIRFSIIQTYSSKIMQTIKESKKKLISDSKIISILRNNSSRN